jgi:hypothetical protein
MVGYPCQPVKRRVFRMCDSITSNKWTELLDIYFPSVFFTPRPDGEKGLRIYADFRDIFPRIQNHTKYLDIPTAAGNRLFSDLLPGATGAQKQRIIARYIDEINEKNARGGFNVIEFFVEKKEEAIKQNYNSQVDSRFTVKKLIPMIRPQPTVF